MTTPTDSEASASKTANSTYTTSTTSATVTCCAKWSQPDNPPLLLIPDNRWVSDPTHLPQKPHKAKAEAELLKAGNMVLSTAATSPLEAEPLNACKVAPPTAATDPLEARKKRSNMGPRDDGEKQLAGTRVYSSNQVGTRKDSDTEEYEAVQVCGNWLST